MHMKIINFLGTKMSRIRNLLNLIKRNFINYLLLMAALCMMLPKMHEFPADSSATYGTKGRMKSYRILKGLIRVANGRCTPGCMTKNLQGHVARFFYKIVGKLFRRLGKFKIVNNFMFTQ